MRVIVGVDLGGTNIVVGTVSEDGERVAGVERRRTPVAQGPDMIVKHIVGAVHESITKAKAAWGSQVEVIGVGIGSPGPIDTKNGIVVTSPNLGWTDVPLRQLVSEIVELPATLENDANCAVLGECWCGAAKGAKVVVGITIGTGVGGGLVLDGKIFHGASDVAGEFGHMTIDSTGRRCVFVPHLEVDVGDRGWFVVRQEGAVAATETQQVPVLLETLVRGVKTQIVFIGAWGCQGCSHRQQALPHCSEIVEEKLDLDFFMTHGCFQWLEGVRRAAPVRRPISLCYVRIVLD